MLSFHNSEEYISFIQQAVEKVLAGAIRREMALEEFGARQAAEIIQLNRLVGICFGFHFVNVETV